MTPWEAGRAVLAQADAVAAAWEHAAARCWEPCSRAVLLVTALEAHEAAIDAYATHARAWPWLVTVRDVEARRARFEQACLRLETQLVEARILMEVERAVMAHASSRGLSLPSRSRIGLA